MMAIIHIVMLSVPQPYSAVQIQIDHFPLPDEVAPKVRDLLNGLVRAASANGMTADTFLQNEFLANGRDQFNQHLREWVPESGLGVWPDRPPPELWKTTDIFKMAGGVRVPLMYRVYRLKGGPKASAEALQLMASSGMAMAILHSDSTEELLKRYKATYLPGITAPNLRIFPFYVPLLDANSLRNRKPDELGRWLGGAHLYLRESPTDKSVLVLADTDLGPLLVNAGAKQEGDGHWAF
ncbi:MAG: hypothetical protein WAO35_28625 [Terriglobia bacterium]